MGGSRLPLSNSLGRWKNWRSIGTLAPWRLSLLKMGQGAYDRPNRGWPRSQAAQREEGSTSVLSWIGGSCLKRIGYEMQNADQPPKCPWPGGDHSSVLRRASKKAGIYNKNPPRCCCLGSNLTAAFQWSSSPCIQQQTRESWAWAESPP